MRIFAYFGGLAALLLLTACDGAPPAQKNAPALPSVSTLTVKPNDVSAVFDYVGRSEASQRVDIRARVKGVLVERPFTEGGDVAAGALMFKIDPAEFDAKRDSAKANVAKAEAAVEEAANSLARYQELVKRDAASVARFDQAKASDLKARAELAAAQASLKTAELDLGYTEISSPIAGRASRANADVGNLIGPDTGVLATVVQLDPIRVVFSIGEREYLSYVENNREKDSPSLTPRIKLANGELYKHKGEFELIDNEVDAATGTLGIRVKFPNPDRLLLPGQFVNVVLTSRVPVSRIVVPQAAVQENQTGPFVVVVDKDNHVETRPIKTGQRVGVDIVALEGLEAGESIVVDGIQKVRPGAKVNPTPIETRQTTEAKPADN